MLLDNAKNERPERPERPDRGDDAASGRRTVAASRVRDDKVTPASKDASDDKASVTEGYSKDSHNTKETEEVADAALPIAAPTEQQPAADLPLDADPALNETGQPQTTPGTGLQAADQVTPEAATDTTIQVVAPALAAPPQIAPIAVTPAAIDDAPATPAESAPSTPAVLPTAGKPAEAKGVEKPAQPQSGAKTEGEAQAGASAGSSVLASAATEIAGRDGEKPSGHQSGAQMSRQGGSSEAPADIAPATHPQKGVDTGAVAQQPSQDAGSRPQPETDVPSRQPGPDAAGAAVKVADTAMQNLGLTASTQGQAANAATNTAQPATAAPTQTASAPVTLAGLAIEIATAAHAGKQRFEIRLDPPELGRIDVRLDVDRDGNVTSRMTVERAETLDLLKRDAVQLERALQQAGLKTSDNALEFSLRQQAFGREENTAQNAARLMVSEDDPAPLETARQGYARMLGLGGGLDIRV